MPSKNTVKYFGTHQYYHVYNRGVAKQNIFLEQADKRYFLSLLDRHLNPDCVQIDKVGMPYKKFIPDLELLSYCLMDNHYHLLFYQADDPSAITEMMRRIGTAYTMYFNLKYKRVGPLFQGRYKASHILSDSYLVHISRYIHLNPREYKTYKYSSLQSYLGDPGTPWLKPDRILSLLEGDDYMNFLQNYEDQKEMLETIKLELANT